MLSFFQIAGCDVTAGKIGEVISLDGEKDQKVSSSSVIPNDFFEDMESVWKGRIKTIHIDDVLTAVEQAAEALHLAVGEKYLMLGSMKAVWFKGKRFKPTVRAGGPGEEQIEQLEHALDSKGRKVGEEWFTTPKVEAALTRYHEANAKAKARVLELLRGLAAELQSNMNILVFTSTLLVIAKALFAHDQMVVVNQVYFGQFVLLHYLGYVDYVPAESALIPYFDSIMLHMKSYDSPADQKSSFQG
ncbi:hypothetical protein SESBI_28581 [Sesbania bispinosa]|nr:hypothetical protein SESBI_28581 [Sesbania bispinosa]